MHVLQTMLPYILSHYHHLYVDVLIYQIGVPT